MPTRIILTVKNPEFSLEYAKEYHFGKESENNWKHLWKHTLEISGQLITPIKGPSKYEYSTAMLKGTLGGAPFEYPVTNVLKYTFQDADGVTSEVVVAGKLLMEASLIPAKKSEKSGKPYLNLILSKRDDFISLYPGMYLTAEDMPAELAPHLTSENLELTFDPSIKLCTVMGFMPVRYFDSEEGMAEINVDPASPQD